MSDIDPEDRVIRQLDVYVSNDLSASATQLSICQFPLRPPWRPYDIDAVNSVRFKPGVKRLEVDVPVESTPQNYNEDVEPHMQLTKTTLRSNKVDTKTSYAVGVLAGDKIILAPVDYCLQLRPTMTYLDATNKKASAKEEDVEEEEEAQEQPELAAVEVQVKKRETERQQMARLNSYAYLMQKEEEEPWLQLNVHSSGTPVSDNIWDTFIKPTDAAVGTPMGLQPYLAAVVPHKANGGPEQEDDKSLVGGSLPSAALDQTKASEAATKQLPAVLKSMFERHKVCSMADIRHWLTSDADAGAAKEVVALTDRALHEAVAGSGNVVCIRRTYLQKKTGIAAIDPIRSLLIEVLKDKENVKKGEVSELAKSSGVKWNDNTFNKVVKEICFSRGNYWQLKPSSDA